jgi:hypothetical protein
MSLKTPDAETDWDAKIEAARKAVLDATNPIAKAYLQGLVVEYQRLAELENDLRLGMSGNR